MSVQESLKLNQPQKDPMLLVCSPWSDAFPVRGLFHGGLYTLDHNLNAHIEAYTTRQLSYQSDILRAFQGVFSIFSNRENPILHHWGIPTRLDDYRDGRPPRNSDYAMRKLPQTQASFSSALAYGLLWRLEYGKNYADRRAGFPSWSWAGWIAPVYWDRLYSKSEQVIDGNVNIKQLSHNSGGSSTFSNEVDHLDTRSNVAFLQGSQSAQVLSIVADVLELRFKLVTGDESVQSIDSQHRYSPPRFQIEAQVCFNNRWISWVLELTARVEKGDSLWKTLQEEPVDCLLLGRRLGLVVWGEGQIKERVGVIRLIESVEAPLREGECWTAKTAMGGRTDIDYNLKHYFPVFHREVLVG